MHSYRKINKIIHVRQCRNTLSYEKLRLSTLTFTKVVKKRRPGSEKRKEPLDVFRRASLHGA